MCIGWDLIVRILGETIWHGEVDGIGLIEANTLGGTFATREELEGELCDDLRAVG